ncbi:MAG: hypothetical protein M1546_25725 [Chloroflexi bacterium]|nr:hypothetical protein [Chloroflexota bacterium]
MNDKLRLDLPIILLSMQALLRPRCVQASVPLDMTPAPTATLSPMSHSG